MSAREPNTTQSLMKHLREKVRTQKHYGGETVATPPRMDIQDCPHCGAAKARQDGVTHCAYCGHLFITVELTEGLYLTPEDNSCS